MTTAAREGLTPAGQRAAALRLRQCALTREEKPVEQLLRFVLGPGGAVAPDLSNKLGGRGVWITATRAALDQAIARNTFAKALKKPVKIDKSLAELVDKQLFERFRNGLSFAAKAGLVTTGFVKVDAALAEGRVVVLVQANDAADDGADRLRRKFDAIAAASGRRAHLSRHFTSDELSMALGRTNVVHAALADGGQADGGQTGAFLRDGLRIERFRLNDETMNSGTLGASGAPTTADGTSDGPSGLDTGRV